MELIDLSITQFYRICSSSKNVRGMELLKNSKTYVNLDGLFLRPQQLCILPMILLQLFINLYRFSLQLMLQLDRLLLFFRIGGHVGFFHSLNFWINLRQSLVQFDNFLCHFCRVMLFRLASIQTRLYDFELVWEWTPVVFPIGRVDVGNELAQEWTCTWSLCY